MFSLGEIWEMIKEAFFAFLLIASVVWMAVQMYILINTIYILYGRGFF